MKLMLSSIILILFTVFACESNPIETVQEINPAFKKYWYQREAEITSFRLQQARYGEIREGNAVTIFVTEPFSTSSMTKADNPTQNDPSVLKLNFTKTFNTGIYPYSMMTSTFLPVQDPRHSLKISSSSQEWCGHTYMELQNKRKFDINISSYFEGESENLSLEKNIIEDDLWSMIRIKPNDLPTGKQKIIPSFFFLRLAHKETKAYQAIASLSKKDDGISSYTIEYPELQRTLRINFETNFPHQINSWEESSYSGFGNQKNKLVTTAERIKTIKSAYWAKNSNKYSGLRDELGLRNFKTVD